MYTFIILLVYQNLTLHRRVSFWQNGSHMYFSVLSFTCDDNSGQSKSLHQASLQDYTSSVATFQPQRQKYYGCWRQLLVPIHSNQMKEFQGFLSTPNVCQNKCIIGNQLNLNTYKSLGVTSYYYIPIGMIWAGR